MSAETLRASVCLPFSVESAVSGPLTWAQHTMYGPMLWFGKEANQFNISRSVVLSRPVPQDRVLEALHHLVVRHQTLRTHYASVDGQPRQQVASSGTYAIAAAADQGDPEAAGARLMAELALEAFDHEAEWPLRMGLTCDASGQVTAIVVVVSHLACDGWAFNRLVDLLLDRVAGRNVPAKPTEPGDALQPLEQAAIQHSAAGQAQNVRGLRHWERWLSAAPSSMFDLPRAETGPLSIERYVLDSVAVTAATSVLAARTRTSIATVLLSLTAFALAAYTSHDVCALKLIAGNRLDRRSREMIALNALDAWLTIPVEDTDLVTAMRRIHRATFDAYRNAECDPRAVRELVRDLGRRRGAQFDLSAYFNNGQRGNEWDFAASAAAAAELPALRQRSRFSALAPVSKSDMKFMLGATPLHDAATRLSLLTDTAFLPAPVGEKMLRGIEALLCAAVSEEIGVSEIAARLDITPAARGAEWVLTPTGWVDLDAVRLLVRRAAGGAETVVFAHEGPGVGEKHTVTACVVAQPDSVRAFHETVLDMLSDYAGAAAPDEYVIVSAAPSDTAVLDAWKGLPHAMRGSGRTL